MTANEAGADVTPMPCAAPTFMPNGGSIVQGSSVDILPPAGFPASGWIFYTTDNSTPTHANPIYSGPIQVAMNETIRAIAYAQGVCTDSPVAAATFVVTPPDAAGGD